LYSSYFLSYVFFYSNGITPDAIDISVETTSLSDITDIHTVSTVSQTDAADINLSTASQSDDTYISLKAALI
jgi:hypothetical protein